MQIYFFEYLNAAYILWKNLIPVHSLHSNPSLRVAYIDEVEEGEQKVYYSVLVKAVDNLDQVNTPWTPHGTTILIYNRNTDNWCIFLKEIYRIKLPGSAKMGEGKPENQNHAIIFTRGEALQAIDMNQVSQQKFEMIPVPPLIFRPLL